ncbi:MAG: Kazal-type serine protease inhibitor domain-containing protein [Planctomycetota bacterium]
MRSFKRFVSVSVALAAVALAFLVSPAMGQETRWSFRRGDANADGTLNLSDAIATFGWLFLGEDPPSCVDAADSNDDGEVNLTDGVFTLNFLFVGGPPPAYPGPDLCDRDPTEDALGCERFAPCVCGGIMGKACGKGETCDFPAGSCGAADMQGACVPMPEVCPDVYEPVCGCDGITYSNDCERLRAGVSKDHEGPCGKVCGTSGDCAKTEFCELPVGVCDSADTPGVCVETPTLCPLFWDPVCGCDGITYSNDCARRVAGVSKRHHGPCKDLPPLPPIEAD